MVPKEPPSTYGGLIAFYSKMMQFLGIESQQLGVSGSSYKYLKSMAPSEMHDIRKVYIKQFGKMEMYFANYDYHHRREDDQVVIPLTDVEVQTEILTYNYPEFSAKAFKEFERLSVEKMASNLFQRVLQASENTLYTKEEFFL